MSASKHSSIDKRGALHFDKERLRCVLRASTPAGRSAAEGAPIRWTELAENVDFREAEPGRTRFARLETEGRSETEIGPGVGL